MPAIIDHDARRVELAAIAAELIAERGVEAATVRAIAEAAGASTKVVSHYLADKRALMLATYRSAAESSAAMAGAAANSADVAAHLASLLPVGPQMVRNWRVWLAFWAFAISDAVFAAEQGGQVTRARRTIETVMMRDPRFAGLAEGMRETAARELITLVIGIAVQAAFDPAEWPLEAQLGPIAERLAALDLAARTGDKAGAGSTLQGQPTESRRE
jgi:AcrR family transcriptional regulator